ncbi:hypothetical protein CRE_24878 [Caenorhabditis remanei]|uniref:Bestrophin homolog n=1 Tax=Caenorhabditis remanei TaxID=31234 RepID=E3NNR7_CAERE|nr:hypothetical protein CRE_24878 [Caenorhabditis remanei]
MSVKLVVLITIRFFDESKYEAFLSITETDRLGTKDTAVLEDFLAIEFSFERLQWFKMEISELSENGVKVFKASEIFSIAQICAGPIIFPMVDQSGYRVSEVEIWSQLRDRTQPIVMQLEAKNLSTKLVSSNSNNIEEFRQSMEMLTKYDWVPIPIAYPQVVFLAVRVYFIICLISRQYLLSAPPTEAQSIVPIMTILQFVFFVGWMKVAEALLNPLGEDDDDFECNWLIDRNMSTGIEIVDTCHDSCPPSKLEEPDDEKGTMYWCHTTKNGSQAPPTAVAISQHKNPFAKVLNMVHPTTPESSPPSYRLDVPKQ